MYSEKLVQSLFDEYEKLGNKYVYACRTHLIRYNDDGSAKLYREWKHEHHQSTPSFDLLATGVGGVLYPPSCLNINPSLIQEICNTSLTADDLFLRKRETDLGLKVKSINIGRSYDMMKGEYNARYSLCCSDNITNNDISIKKLGLKKSNGQPKSDIVVIYRICDKVEAVHGKREFGSKDDAIKKCFPTFCGALRQLGSAERKFSYRLVVVEDSIRDDTRKFLEDELSACDITATFIKSEAPGNMGSFKTCFNEAIGCDDDQLVLFIEDDYLCDLDSFRELILFYRMFDAKTNSIFLNPTTDTGSFTNIPVVDGKYMMSAVLPSSKSGKGIWWRQTFHSTSTFATNVRNLRKYEYVFKAIFKQKELTERIRNRIFRVCPCFQPLYPLFQHYQRHKTVYWFSEDNNLPDSKYQDKLVKCFNPSAKVDIVS